ncbi:MAG: AAA family ATPase [Muribaculaceae bacterium]|nr:AAA family ATPase [Muribaculaceae bacterium]
MQLIDYTKLSENSKSLLQHANSLARESHFDEITTPLILIAMVRQSKEMLRFVLDQLNVDYQHFCTRLSEYIQNTNRFHNDNPQFSEQCNQVIVKTISSYTEHHRGLVPTEAIFLEMTSTNNEVSALFNEFHINHHRLSGAIETYSAGNRITSTDNGQQAELINLEKYAVNLRKLAEIGEIEPTIGRDDEIRRILQIVSRKTKNNPLLIGEPGTGKTAIIEGLAFRLNRGDVPEDLKHLQLYSLDIATMVAGASMQGEFEARLKSIVNELKHAPQVLLFIDEIHLLLSAGSGGGAMDAANILKPELARNGIKVIGATTFDEYNRFVENDQAFARRFQRITIDEPSVESSISILRGIKSRFEAHHRIKILDEAIVASVRLSTKYVTDRFLPDKAIDVLDETASRMRIDRSSVPEELDSLSRIVRQKEIERESLLQDAHDFPRINELEHEISQLKERENILNAKWVNERRQFDRLQEFQNTLIHLHENCEQAESIGRYDEAARYNRETERVEAEMNALMQEMADTASPLLKLALDSNDIKETITRFTGIPVHSMNEDELTRLTRMQDFLADIVKGQDHAIHSVCNVIKRSRLGLGNDNAPIGSFMFTGTTGVGKTALAKALAQFLFGSRDMLIRIDMSEYQQEHNVSRLFGAPPGYVGYDQGGQLTEAVRRRPYSVILLDEIEKAHPKICETLLQVLDDGHMTDGKGRTINFKNTVIIMTSNLGAELIEQQDDTCLPFVREPIIQLLKHRTSPEFINRIDDIIIFNPLNGSVLKSITMKIVHNAVQKLQSSGYNIQLNEDVADHIAHNLDTSMGARPIKRIVDHEIIDGIIDKILMGDLVKSSPIYIRVCNNKLSFTNE